MKAKMVSLALLAIMMISAVSIAYAPSPPNADAMWITPTAIDGAAVGYHNTFDVTVWFNVSAHPGVPNNGANSWQFYMIYKSAFLNATACVYSGVGKSQWSAALPVDTVAPGFGAHNLTYNYVVLGEVLKSSAEKAGYGSLAVVTFNVTGAPGKYETLISQIRLDNDGIFKSQSMDAGFAPIALNFGYATFTWVWVAPPPAQIKIDPTSQPLGGGGISIIGNTFTETVKAVLDVGWACHNITFDLTNSNQTLITISSWTVDPLWATYTVDNTTTPGVLSVMVKDPTSTPSNPTIITIKYKVIDEPPPDKPTAWTATLTFSNVHFFDTTAEIGQIAPNSCLVSIKGIVTRTPAYLQVSSVTMGPNPVVGQTFNVTVKVMDLDHGWFFIGLDFRLAFPSDLISYVNEFEGPFLPYYSSLQPGSLGTWFISDFWPADAFYPDNVIVGNLIFPNASGMWPTHTAVYPNSAETVPAVCGNTVATIMFRVEYQSFGEANLTAPLDIIEQHWVGIADPNATDQEIIYLDFRPPHNGTYSITTTWPGKMVDAYTQYPAPFGGQGWNMPSDMFWPQKQVELYANVTYNYWPVQQKDVAFEVRDPWGNLWTQQVARTDVDGVAHTSYRIPWPCDHPELLFGVWTVYVTVDLYCTVINDTIRFHFDYLTEIFSVTTDKFQYNHCDEVKVTVNFGTHAQQLYPLLLYVVIYDNVNVPVGFALINMTIGGTQFCQYKNYTATVSIHIPKFAAAGIATVIVNAFNKLPSMGGSAYCPTYGDGWPIGSTIPTIAIQPY